MHWCLAAGTIRRRQALSGDCRFSCAVVLPASSGSAEHGHGRRPPRRCPSEITGSWLISSRLISSRAWMAGVSGDTVRS